MATGDGPWDSGGRESREPGMERRGSDDKGKEEAPTLNVRSLGLSTNLDPATCHL